MTRGSDLSSGPFLSFRYYSAADIIVLPAKWFCSRGISADVFHQLARKAGNRSEVARLRVDRDQLCATRGIPTGDYVQSEVSDTGCGITEEGGARAKIFDPFFTTKTASRGLSTWRSYQDPLC
jgi:hypothetical protein